MILGESVKAVFQRHVRDAVSIPVLNMYIYLFQAHWPFHE